MNAPQARQKVLLSVLRENGAPETSRRGIHSVPSAPATTGVAGGGAWGRELPKPAQPIAQRRVPCVCARRCHRARAQIQHHGDRVPTSPPFRRPEDAPALQASKSIRAHNRARAVRKRRAIRLPKGGRPIRNREGSRGELVQECAQRRRGLALPQTRPPSCLPGRARWPPRAHLGLRRSRKLYRSSESAPHFCVHITVGAKPSATR